MKVLVTGGAGFIGSHLVEALAARGDTVRVLDNLSSGRLENLAAVASRIELLEGDIRDYEVVRRAMIGCDLVFHQAALVSVPRSIKEPRLNHDINVSGTFNIFEAAREAGIRRVVYASSAAIYGDNQNLPLRESELPAPLSPYGAAKLINEDMAAAYNQSYDLSFVGLRYFNAFGPRQDPSSPYSGVLSIFCERLKEGRPLTILGDGRQSRDFVYVGDIVQANLKAAEVDYGTSGPLVFNVARGEQTDLLRLIEVLTKGYRPAEPPHLEFKAPREGDIRHSLADIGRARAALGFAPGVSLAEGIERMLADIRPAIAG